MVLYIYIMYYILYAQPTGSPEKNENQPWINTPPGFE